MVDINRHRLYLFEILKEIYEDKELAGTLGFKGGTALMFFYNLPRFSTDLDFNLLIPNKADLVYNKIREIVLKHGEIDDEAKKFYSLLFVLNYGEEERMLKLEISKRNYGDRYEIKDLMGIKVEVMVAPDMFAHKLCALLDRSSITNRDIFDTWFFMKTRTPLNQSIVEQRMKVTLPQYIQKCIDQLEQLHNLKLLDGLGELVDTEIKQFVRTNLRQETITLLKFYQKYPILEE